MTLRTLNYGNYGIFLIMGNAGFCPSTVVKMLILLRSLGRVVVGIGLTMAFLITIICAFLRDER